jgi:hypothetical protein
LGEQIKQNEMGGACGHKEEKRYGYRVLVGTPVGRRPRESLGVYGRIILKWI